MNTLLSQLNTDTIQKYLLYGFLFLLPTQLGTFFFLPISYINGLRIDYLAPAVYLTDLLVILLIIFNRKLLQKQLQRVSHLKWILLILVIVFIVNIDTAIQPLIAMYRIIKLLEAFTVFLIIRNSNIKLDTFVKIFLAAALTQISISMYQVLLGHSVQGGAYYLGERSFSLSTPGIAKVAINGVEFLRGYGTFSHPNSLAGFYLLVYAYVLFSNKLKGLWKHAFLGVCMLLIVFSFSKTAILAVLVLAAYYAIRHFQNCIICTISRVAVPCILALLIFSSQGDSESLQKRVWLTESAMRIISSQPLSGVGLGNYLYAQAVFPIPYTYVFLQPVHNIFLLLIAEVGIPLFVYMAYLFIKNIKDQLADPRLQGLLIALLLTGMFDHYWLTLQQNFLLLPVVFGLLQNHKSMVQ